MSDARQTEHQAWGFAETSAAGPREPALCCDLNSSLGNVEGKRRFVGQPFPQNLAAIEKHFSIPREAMTQREIPKPRSKRCLGHPARRSESGDCFRFAR